MYVVFPPVNTAIFELLIVLMACWSHVVSKSSFCLITHSPLDGEGVLGDVSPAACALQLTSPPVLPLRKKNISGLMVF